MAGGDCTGALLLRARLLEGSLKQLAKSLTGLRSDLLRQESVSDTLEDELISVYGSVSWRITKPLRKIKKLGQKLGAVE